MGFLSNLFASQHWTGSGYDQEKAEGATFDLQVLRDTTLALVEAGAGTQA